MKNLMWDLGEADQVREALIQEYANLYADDGRIRFLEWLLDRRIEQVNAAPYGMKAGYQGA